MWRNVRRFPSAVAIKGLSVIRFDSQLYFANTNFFQSLILDVAADLSRRGEPVTANPVPAAPTTEVAGTTGADAGADAGTPAPVLSAGAAPAAAGSAIMPAGTPSLSCLRKFTGKDRHVVVDMGVVSHVDYSALHMLTELPEELEKAGLGHVRLWLTNVRGPVRDALRRMLQEEHREDAKKKQKKGKGKTGAAEADASARVADASQMGAGGDGDGDGDGDAVAVTLGAPKQSDEEEGEEEGHAGIDSRLFSVSVNGAVEYILCMSARARNAAGAGAGAGAGVAATDSGTNTDGGAECKTEAAAGVADASATPVPSSSAATAEGVELVQVADEGAAAVVQPVTDGAAKKEA